MRQCWLRAGVVPLGLALAVPVEARPADGNGATSSQLSADVSNPPIHIVVVGGASEVEALKDAIATWRLGDRPVHWQRVSAFEPMSLLEDRTEGVSCTIDLRSGRTTRLYFKNSGTQRYLLRSLETSGSLNEMDKEVISQAVELSLLALLEDRETGLTKEDTKTLLAPAPLELPEAIPKEPLPEREVPRIAFTEASVGYQFLPLLDRGSWVHGPSIAFGRSYGGIHRFALGAAAHLRFEESWQSEWAALSLQSTAFWLQAEWRPLLVAWNESEAEGQRLGIGVGAGMEFVRTEPRPGGRSDGVALTDSRLRVAPNLRLQLESLSTVTTWLVLRAGVLLEVAPTATDYDVSVSGRTETALRSLRVRPGASLGATLVWD